MTFGEIFGFMVENVVGGLGASGIPLAIYYFLVKGKKSIWKPDWIRYGVACLIIFWGAQYSYSLNSNLNDGAYFLLAIGSFLFTGVIYALSSIYYIVFKKNRHLNCVEVDANK